MNLLRQAVPSRGNARILDVGCGSCGYLQHAGTLNEQCTGVGLESDPSVAEQARENIKSWGLSGRFQIVQGDVRNVPDSLDGSFDLILCINNLYYFAPVERAPLYARLREMLMPGGTLMIACSFQGKGRDVFTANLNAATVSIRGCWPLPELKVTGQLLREAGFANVKTSRLMPGSSVFGVLARKE